MIRLIKKNIIIFGYKNTFGPNILGGLDSFYRRISFIYSKHNYNVIYLLYGYYNNNIFKVSDNITIINCISFSDSIHILNNTEGTVIVNAIHRNNRLSFIKYRLVNKNRSFHLVYSVYSEGMLTRNLYLLESFLYPYNGIGLCFSPRLESAVRRRRNNACTFLPPVKNLFFQKPKILEAKVRINVSFLGRIDPGKGTKRFTDIAEHFSKDKRFLFNMYGYTWPNCNICKNEEDRINNLGFIKYHKNEHSSWSTKIEKDVASILHRTDVLILPYQKLSSTTDIPVLLLEGMAASCCVIIPDLGDLSFVYGKSEFVLREEQFVDSAIKLLYRLPEIIENEKKRVWKRVKELKVSESGTFDRLKSLQLI